MVEKFYDNNADQFFKSTINADMHEMYSIFQKYLHFTDGEILDLGCGSGRDSKYFLQCGYDVTSIDLSVELAKIASRYIGKEVIVKDMRELDYYEKFIGIWACASLLHLKEYEILETLEKCYLALIKDGVLYASFKYGDSNYTKDGRNFTCFTKEKIIKMIELTKFTIINVFETFDVRIGRENEKWINILLRK